MINTLRIQIGEAQETLTRLDGELARAVDGPPLALATTLVDLAKVTERLRKLAGRLTPLLQSDAQPERTARKPRLAE